MARRAAAVEEILAAERPTRISAAGRALARDVRVVKPIEVGLAPVTRTIREI